MFQFLTRCVRHGSTSSLLHIASLAMLMVHTVAPLSYSWSQTQAVEGHVLHASLHSKLQGVLVMAWPCRFAAATDAAGAFRVACPHGIDSITISCIGFKSQTISADGGHTDVWLEELSVSLDQALVTVNRSHELESHVLSRVPLLEALDATPGLQSLDLGAGMVQPVIRGLFGSRVAVLENGVPQQGGRWGTDHGVLVAPELQVTQSWAPGGGHAWMGPDAMGGGLRFESPSLVNSSGTSTRYGAQARLGNAKGQVYALHTSTDERNHWHAGISATGFGSTRVPQRTFSYIGRTYVLETGELPNTGGQSAHAVVGLGRRFNNGGIASLSLRASDVRQGLFPGIIGVPVQGDLAPAENSFLVGIPAQHASRVLSTLEWLGPNDGRGRNWTGKAAYSWNQRLEFAPPHAHGWGPEPSSELSLSFKEHTLFTELRSSGPHVNFGVQTEGQFISTSGWEFLVPNHRRFRFSGIAESQLGSANIAARFDVVQSSQEGHEEPLYNAAGEAIGIDVRALPFERLMPGGMLSWLRPFTNQRKPLEGSLALVLQGRVPSHQEWGANGIHHGTFRFERGNPDLTTEWTAEGRVSLRQKHKEWGVNWKADAFAAMHKGFISLSPSATFAPISHAGQVYEFTANDAFRTGMEATISHRRARQTWKGAGSILGQWNLRSGLGLPFTTPAQLRVSWEGRSLRDLSLEVSGRAVARTWITARNEASTPGAFLADIILCQTTEKGQWSLQVHNALDTPWLDHISAYRALGLVAQGRWVQLSFSTTLEHSSN